MGKRITINKGEKYGKLTVIKEVNPRIDSKGRKYRKSINN